MHSVILEIKERFDIGRWLFNASLSRVGFLSSGLTMDCLKCMGKGVPVDRERLTMVVIIGRIVKETCFRKKMGIGSRLHCLLGEACKSSAIWSVDAGGNDDNTLGVRGGFE